MSEVASRAATARSHGPSGVLLVDKPERLTSHDVVDEVRKLLGTTRVGHTGTLDPIATGLLVLCVGKAGRLQAFLTGLDKTYEGRMRLGVATDTYDSDGSPVGEPHSGPHPDADAVAAVAARYVGDLTQSPPPFSAKKFGGKKFYELARKGESVPDLPKKVRVARLELGAMDGELASFTVECSSGTYVRSLVHDIGRDLSVGAHLVALRRTAIGRFNVSDAVTLPDLAARPPETRLSAPSWLDLADVPLPFPAIALQPTEAAKIRRGQAVAVRPSAEAAAAPWVRLTADGQLLALAQLEPIGRGAVSLARPKIVLGD